jgi:crotonobetainyl-CoA:carnitine CoA-transferase CaiB-like acyl-CoA transferase
MAAAFAILAAVLCARRTGEPEHIDLAITDLLASWVAPMGSIDAEADRALVAADLPGMGAFATVDGGYVELGVFTENQLWDVLCDSLGLQHHIGLPMTERTAQAARLRADLAAVIVHRSRDELVGSLGARGVPVAPILTRDEMLDHPYFASRGVIVRGPSGRRMVAHPIRYRNHPALRFRPAPTLGVSG